MNVLHALEMSYINEHYDVALQLFDNVNSVFRIRRALTGVVCRDFQRVCVHISSTCIS